MGLMQLFVTHACPRLSAQALDDARVVNQCRETAQLICTVLDQQGFIMPYRLTHLHHPVTRWAMAGIDELDWAVRHLISLRDEHLYRYPSSSEHRSASLVLGPAQACLVILRHRANLPRPAEPAEFCNAAANRSEGLDFKHLPTFQAYRAYLGARWLTGKRAPTWTRRGMPEWFGGGLS